MSPDRDDPLALALNRRGLSTIDGVFAYSGGQDLHKPRLNGRTRTRLSVTDDAGRPHELYLKRYRCVSRRRRLLGGCRVSRGRREFRNIVAVAQAGVLTMRPVAFGEDMGLLGERRSYVLFEAVPGEPLSRCGEEFFARARRQPPLMDAFNRRLLDLVCQFHRAGLAHRDLYASHLFLHEHDQTVDLYLIDLARVFKPRWRRMRWRVKDLAALRYSLPQSWAAQWWDHFLYHWIENVGEARSMGCWQRAVMRRVRWMQRRAERRADR